MAILTMRRSMRPCPAQGRGDKVLVFKFKRKKQYRRLKGHRQNYTELTIGDVRL